MRAVSIVISYPPKYVQTHEDRDFLKVGEQLTGYVTLDEPRRPKRIEIRWCDCRGRVLGRTKGRYEPYNRRVCFEFSITQNPFWLHRIECEIDGVLQEARAEFAVAPSTQGWETMPAITWASYPDGEFHDRLQEVGVNAEIAFKMKQFENVVLNGMRFYVDNSTPDEISVYHRPHRLFWEPPEEAKPPYVAWGRGYRDNWKAILARYVRMRERARRDGVMISCDLHFRKLLWRDFCPNAPGTITEAVERLAAVVRQHKGFRPLFYNMADEAGITDQCKPFDYCYCPWCMDKFRRQLEQKYGTLTRLNAEWGTDFSSWDEVYPLTTDETMEGQKSGQPLNFASWNDHRAFMDDTFVEFFRKVREQGKHWDPIGDFGQGGCQAPAAYGGWDYAKVVEHMDAIIPYNIGGNQEVIRSIRPGLKCLSPFFGDDERHVRGLWYAYIHGNAGVVFWDADEPTGRFVERPSGRLSKRGKLFGPVLREIRGGYAQQFKVWSRRDDLIGLLYSQPSLRAHWLMEALARRKTSEWFALDSDESRYMHVRLSWQQLIEDLQLQYRYVSYLAVDEGTVDLGQFRLLILPETLAVSARLANALRDFVAHGGVLVADGRCGRMSDNCRELSKGLLDDLFGVTHGSNLTLEPGPSLRPPARLKRSWLDLEGSLSALNGLERDLRLAADGAGEAAASAGEAPALIRRRFGAGWVIYLNTDVHAYNWERYHLDRPAPLLLRRLLDALVALAGICPSVRVTEQTLGTAAGIEVTRFGQEGAELVVALMNRTYRVSGVGEKLDEDSLAVFEKDRKLMLHFDRPAHT
ncbi:MAG: beta-galactosidase, partial [Kiritimatiellia bacterium]